MLMASSYAMNVGLVDEDCKQMRIDGNVIVVVEIRRIIIED